MSYRIKFFRQHDNMDCGPTCLKMIACYYGKDHSIDSLRNLSGITRKGVTLFGLKAAAENIGIEATGVRVSLDQIDKGAIQLPCIIHWKEHHFVVLFKTKHSFFGKLLGNRETSYLIGDPGHGIHKVNRDTFRSSWIGNKSQGVALVLKPTAAFFEKQVDKSKSSPFSFALLLGYLRPYRKYLAQVGLGMLLSSLLALLLPFLMQGLVDFGIRNKNPSFVTLILFSQVIIFVGASAIDVIRNWILLHVNIRVSVSIISEFLDKIMRLPISFFDSKNIGDITQRISDHSRVEAFLTGSAMGTLFSLMNLLVFAVVLSIYSSKIFFIFMIGSALSVYWIMYFLSKRKDLDYARFQHLKDNQTAIYEIVDGINEIKLNNWEYEKRKNWEGIQGRLFKITSKYLALEQTQEIGANGVLQLKNVVISYISALMVIQGDLSLGQMLGISFIIGQMNAPLNQLIAFIRSIQDAKISFERLTEIQTLSNEDAIKPYDESESQSGSDSLKGITLVNVSFQYGFQGSPRVLDNINLFIPQGKTTAIVGSSGSGKSTLLKLLLRLYNPTEGIIKVDGTDLACISPAAWRGACGTVMQDGYIFSDTILRNIVLESEADKIDEIQLQHAVEVANLQDYIGKLPLGLSSFIGNTGMGISGGQKQRILIARAAYKNPRYLFFDEATSSLDANNEKAIMNNFDTLFAGKTVLVIAHRLSTVKNADQIVVMDDGRITEIGSHHTLLSKKGKYYELVKNQLHSELIYN